jgi:hypothetical protein
LLHYPPYYYSVSTQKCFYYNHQCEINLFLHRKRYLFQHQTLYWSKVTEERGKASAFNSNASWERKTVISPGKKSQDGRMFLADSDHKSGQHMEKLCFGFVHGRRRRRRNKNAQRGDLLSCQCLRGSKWNGPGNKKLQTLCVSVVCVNRIVWRKNNTFPERETN